MTTRKVIKEAGLGRFVSADYAAEHPNTTYEQPVSELDHLAIVLDDIETAGWDWTLYFYREPSLMPAGTQRYELEAWRQPVGYVRQGGRTVRDAAHAALTAIGEQPDPVPSPEPPENEGTA